MTVAPPVPAQNVLQKCRQLAERVWHKYLTVDSNERVIIAISGIPGAGKSTISGLVVQQVNDIFEADNNGNGVTQKSPLAVAIPMDGFHLTRAQLKQMPEPEVATHRRGAAFTYDAEGFLAFIQRLRKPVTGGETIYGPSFDHATKDPVENDIEILPTSRIIIIEGNYCALNRGPWAEAAKLMDELWFVSIDREVARGRLALRHVKSGVTADMESALDRISSTDFLNADDIEQNMLRVQEVIHVS